MNVDVALQYINSWLLGNGAAAIYNLMEDAATAEISRAQVWQQVRARLLTPEKLDQVMREELEPFSGGQISEARTLFRALCTAETFEEFLTVPAYQRLTANEP